MGQTTVTQSTLEFLPFLEVNENDEKSCLGKGSFGTTRVGYLHSIDGRSKVKVAIKIPNQAAITKIDAKHFQEEARTLANIKLPGDVPHPYLVRLLAFVPERCAIVMEFCEGDLQWYRSKDGPGALLSVPEQVELMEKASAGCCWIVEKKLVHRDLKMQNILIARETADAGRSWKFVPKIADFGLAQQRTVGKTGVAGTCTYMAPEAYDGDMSEKSDVYSFGHVRLSKSWKESDPWLSERLLQKHCTDAV
eukprot:4637479-Amphidinium_carterae.1